MDNNEIAKQLTKFGNREARYTRKLVAVQEERCAFLQGLTSGADLAPEVVALTVAPKDEE